MPELGMNGASLKVFVRGSAAAKAGTKARTKTRRDASLLGGTAVRTLLIAVSLVPLAAIERAEAACTPATSKAAPANDTTVTCTTTTTDQNADNVTSFSGYGTGRETGVTINVQSGASVTSSSNTPGTP